MKIIKSILFITLFFSVFASCKSKKDNKDKVVNKPYISTKEKPAPPKLKGTLPKELSADVKKIGPTDELTCENICLQQGYCQMKLKGKKPPLRRHTRCIALCNQKKKSEKQKEIVDISKHCVDKFRGDNCDKLRECFNKEVKKLQKKLHGKK